MDEPTTEGLTIIKRFLTPGNQNYLMNVIDLGDWSTCLKRRVQQFGRRYDYAARRIAQEPEASPIPEWGRHLIQQMVAAKITYRQFDQLIVNEYLPGQGIAPHIDSPSYFGPEIVSLSLGSTCVMQFSSSQRTADFEIFLEPGDLLRITGRARYEWRHQIRPRKNDRWEGQLIERKRRLSITFREATGAAHLQDL